MKGSDLFGLVVVVALLLYLGWAMLRGEKHPAESRDAFQKALALASEIEASGEVDPGTARATHNTGFRR